MVLILTKQSKTNKDMAKKKNIEITSHSWVNCIYPMFGNKHLMPYGTIKVKGLVDGVEITQYCKTKGDTYEEHSPYQYIVFQGQRFIVFEIAHNGLNLIRWDKEKVGKYWRYTDHIEI